MTTALVHYALGGEWERIALLAVFCFGFRQLTTVHYGIGVMMLTALIVVLLTFEGVAPGDTMMARAHRHRDRQRARLARLCVVADLGNAARAPGPGGMIDAYRRYFALP